MVWIGLRRSQVALWNLFPHLAFKRKPTRKTTGGHKENYRRKTGKLQEAYRRRSREIFIVFRV